ncbi:MAG: nucleotidyltransferase family protein [Thermodesulfobacteriota bacterium]
MMSTLSNPEHLVEAACQRRLNHHEGEPGLGGGELMYNRDLLQRIMIPPDSRLKSAMEVMTQPPGSPMAVVVDESQVLLGVIVDTDIRKALLSGYTLDTPVREVMNPNPIWLPVTIDQDFLHRFFRKQPRKAIPLLDGDGRIQGLVFSSQFLSQPQDFPNWVVLMAGGLGSRLRPLTNDRPKPMLQVGNTPLLETIIRQFLDHGFSRFMISVRYKAELIKEYFGDGSKWDATIEYLEERSPLGTAGALSLVKKELDHALIIMNGDLLTRVNFKALAEFHQDHGNAATMCVREHLMEVPYGVVQINGVRLKDIVEKPVYRLMVNAGIYVLEPEVLNLVPPNQKMDMPDLFQRVKKELSKPVGCFPISEYWLDIGRPEDHELAQLEFDDVFGAGSDHGKLSLVRN